MNTLIPIFAAFSALPSLAFAGHIEITADIRSPAQSGNSIAANFSLVFDTDTAPTFGANDRLIFQAVQCDLQIPLEGTSALPFSIGEPNAQCTAEFTDAKLEYFPGSDVYQITISRVIDGQPTTMSLAVESPAGDFSESMTSLPDTPEDYAFAGSGLDSVFVNLDIGPQAEFAIWSTNSSFGAFSFSARSVDLPAPALCSPADLDQNGELNFFDVATFLEFYAKGCP